MSTKVSAMDQLDPHGVGNYISPAGLAAFFAALFGALPVILGVIGGTLAIGWYSVALWESKTVQNYVKGRRAARLARGHRAQRRNHRKRAADTGRRQAGLRFNRTED